MTNATETIVCWKCGASIQDQLLPLSRTAECNNCGADLYVCKMCRFYDTHKAKSCQETITEEVRDKERANFCDYLSLKPDAYSGTEEKQNIAKRQLEALFGQVATTTKESCSTLSKDEKNREALENLFKKPQKKS